MSKERRSNKLGGARKAANKRHVDIHTQSSSTTHTEYFVYICMYGGLEHMLLHAAFPRLLLGGR